MSGSLGYCLSISGSKNAFARRRRHHACGVTGQHHIAAVVPARQWFHRDRGAFAAQGFCALQTRALAQAAHGGAQREALVRALSRVRRSPPGPESQPAGEPDEVLSAVLANASIAAMDIVDGSSGPSVAALLEEINSSTQRAADLYARIRSFTAP